jgi:hypothetical protein
MKRFLLLLALVAAGCSAEVLVERPAAERAPVEGRACDGDDPDTFCDDCNPCTAKANCTPCSALPETDRDIHRCTADEELPAFCTGRTGCYHVPLTTPAGQSNDCFPVAGAADLEPGVCRAGVCVGDPT